jgi:tetratricopeptide (TPR) repeat protein
LEATDYLQKVLRKIDSRLLSDAPQEAVEIAQAALNTWPDDPALLRRLGVALEAAGRREEAIIVFERANENASVEKTSILTVAEIKFYFALCLASARQYERAAALAEEVIALGVRGASIFATASTARFHLGQIDAALKWGNEALKMRDTAAASSSKVVSLGPLKRTRAFDPSNPSKNVLSYSLFGNSTYYFEGAITNSKIAMANFPDFSTRFYCGEEVPHVVLNELKRLGADVKIIKGSISRWEGLFWRFWAFDDPSVDVVLVRDVDSPLTARERIAVEDWLYNSEAPFHVMRDSPTHTNPIMAGLWGGFTGFLPPLEPLIRDFLRGGSYRYADQSFLNRHVWPAIREATLTHDSNYEFVNTRRFPPWGRVTRSVHVGWAWPTTIKRGRSAF